MQRRTEPVTQKLRQLRGLSCLLGKKSQKGQREGKRSLSQYHIDCYGLFGPMTSWIKRRPPDERNFILPTFQMPGMHVPSPPPFARPENYIEGIKEFIVNVSKLIYAHIVNYLYSNVLLS